MGIYNFDKSSRNKTFSSDSCVSSVALSPDLEYFAYGIGNDWSRGLNELHTMSPTTPKIMVLRLTVSDINYSTTYSSYKWFSFIEHLKLKNNL